MAQQNYSEKFYSLLRQFIKNLEEQYPELKKELADYRKYVKGTKKTKFTKNFYNRFQPYSEDISNCNYQRFEEATEPIFLFKNVDFRQILKKDIDTKNKEIIMQYLQSLYLIVNMIISGDELMKAFKNFANPNETTKTEGGLENFDVMKNMINNLSKTMEENQEETTNTNENTTENTEENNNKETKPNLGPFGFIEELAEEIAKDIEIPEELKNGEGNPGDLFQKMFFGENNAFSSMVSKVGQKIHQKMESGELDTEKLMKETTGMMGNLQDTMSQMQNDPEFMKQMGPMANMMQSMMGGMMGGGKGGMPNMGNMMKMMSSMMGGGGDNNDDEEMPDLEELQEKWKKSRNQEYRASMAKERLRRKLENKRKVALNQQRFQEKSLKRKGTNNENSNLVENKEE